MTELGILLLVVGVALLVAEAHLPTAGVLGAIGVVSLGAGGWLALTGAGAAAAVAVGVAGAVVVVAAAFLVFVVAKVARTRRMRVGGGTAGVIGHVGTVRGAQQVFVDGALWRARVDWHGDHDELHEGDPVVVERVNGLTLCVRKADPWELEA